jgi:hypothetical protein
VAAQVHLPKLSIALREAVDCCLSAQRLREYCFSETAPLVLAMQGQWMTLPPFRGITKSGQPLKGSQTEGKLLR